MGNTTNENIESVAVMNGVEIDFVVLDTVAWPAVNGDMLATLMHYGNHATSPPQPASLFRKPVMDTTLSAYLLVAFSAWLSRFVVLVSDTLSFLKILAVRCFKSLLIGLIIWLLLLVFNVINFKRLPVLVLSAPSPTGNKSRCFYWHAAHLVWQWSWYWQGFLAGLEVASDKTCHWLLRHWLD